MGEIIGKIKLAKIEMDKLIREFDEFAKDCPHHKNHVRCWCDKTDNYSKKCNWYNCPI